MRERCEEERGEMNCKNRVERNRWAVVASWSQQVQLLQRLAQSQSCLPRGSSGAVPRGRPRVGICRVWVAGSELAYARSTFKTVAVSSTQLAPPGLFGPSRSHRGARRIEWLAGSPNQDVDTPCPHTDIYGQEKLSMVQPACLLFAGLCLAWPFAGHMKHPAYADLWIDTLLAEVSCTLKRLLSDPM